jgi:hypothetical protein
MQASFEILDGYGLKNNLIGIAAKTCYRSEDVSKKTDDEFVSMLISQGHNAMLEFSYWVVKLRVNLNTQDDRDKLVNNIFTNFSAQKYFEVYAENADIIVSANGRAWREYFLSRQDILADYDYNIITEFQKRNRPLFGDIKGGNISNRVHLWVLEDSTIRSMIMPLRQQLDWIAVKFVNVSRGLTAELNRNRSLQSTAEQSSRYVNLQNFNYLCVDSEGYKAEMDEMIVDHCMETIKLTYSYLLGRGYNKDTARHLLPLGTQVSIIKAGTLAGWIRAFELRTVDRAHFEIRGVMKQLEAEFKKKGLL